MCSSLKEALDKMEKNMIKTANKAFDDIHKILLKKIEEQNEQIKDKEKSKHS